ncbi:MAG: adenine phosphoribosyltransferase [Micrococcaceae bacterium]|nr:adenine phosphoribosyltransferase [Micrococcaceae bacterium]
MTETMPELRDRLWAIVPDYPQPGVSFKDLTPAFADADGLRRMIDEIIAPFAGTFDVVAGVEARGFVLAAAAAYASGTGMVTIRKKGKLPRPVHAEQYTLEYGTATLELHRDDIKPGTRVLLLDDVLATGGTITSAAALLSRAQAEIVGIGVVLELAELRGRERLQDYPVKALQLV